MKKIIICSTMFLLLISCNGSKKGAWSKEDKLKAEKQILESEGALEFLGNNKQQFIDCYLENVENSYESFDDANADPKGSDELTASCLESVLMSK
jgi:hypothetical protein